MNKVRLQRIIERDDISQKRAEKLMAIYKSTVMKLLEGHPTEFNDETLLKAISKANAKVYSEFKKMGSKQFLAILNFENNRRIDNTIAQAMRLFDDA